MCAISPFSPCSWFPLYLLPMPKSCTENTRTHMREERRKWREVMHTKAREATTTTDGWTGNRHPPTSLDGLSEQARGNRLRRVLLQLQFLLPLLSDHRCFTRSIPRPYDGDRGRLLFPSRNWRTRIFDSISPGGFFLLGR